MDLQNCPKCGKELTTLSSSNRKFCSSCKWTEKKINQVEIPQNHQDKNLKSFKNNNLERIITIFVSIVGTIIVMKLIPTNPPTTQVAQNDATIKEVRRNVEKNKKLEPSEQAIKTKELLDRIKIQMETGISLNEYSDDLADIKYAYTQIKNKNEQEKFKKLIETHELTYGFWRECFDGYGCSEDYSYRLRTILDTYPEIASKEGDSLYSLTLGGSTKWSTDLVVQDLFKIIGDETTKIEL